MLTAVPGARPLSLLLLSPLLLRLLLLLLVAACAPTKATAPPPTCPQDPGAELPTSAPGRLAFADHQRRLRGLAALDAGRFDVAREEFAAILAVTPDNLAVKALFEAATRALSSAQLQAAERFAAAIPTAVPAPPWQHTVVRELTIDAGPAPKLVQLSATPNHGTDELEWFRRHGLRLPEYEVPNPMRGQPGTVPPTAPPTYGTHLLVQAIGHPDHTILIYGPSYSAGRFVLVLDARDNRVAFLDFDAYRVAPAPASAEQHAIWAEVRDGVLYISHSSADRLGAYITALDIGTGAVRWRSDPLVAGAANFVIHHGHILTGHGLPREPAHVFVLDRRTGLVVDKHRLASAPEYLFVQGDKLLVRSRDTDHSFELR